MPRQIGGIGELLLISLPQLFRVRVGLGFIKGRRRVGKVFLRFANIISEISKKANNDFRKKQAGAFAPACAFNYG